MRFCNLALIAATGLPASVFGECPPGAFYGGNPLIVPLCESNFASQTATGIWMVEFYQPWCPTCQGMAYHYGVMASAIAGRVDLASEVKVGAVDCQVEPALCTSLSIDRYPSFIAYVNGASAVYWKSRSPLGMVQHMARLKAARDTPGVVDVFDKCFSSLESSGVEVLCPPKIPNAPAEITKAIVFHKNVDVAGAVANLAVQLEGVAKVAVFDCLIETVYCSQWLSLTDNQADIVVKVLIQGSARFTQGSHTSGDLGAAAVEFVKAELGVAEL